MIKKILLLLFFCLFITGPVLASSEDGITDKKPLARSATVFGRGLVNLVTLPIEIPRSVHSETGVHSRLWPVTFLPRTATNLIYRATSAVNDIVFFPWVVLFTDHIAPWTKPMGLPDYPWQFEQI